MGIPTYEVIGYTADADTWCVDCALEEYGAQTVAGGRMVEPLRRDSEGNIVHPVFAGDEFDAKPYCNKCREPLLS